MASPTAYPDGRLVWLDLIDVMPADQKCKHTHAPEHTGDPLLVLK